MPPDSSTGMPDLAGIVGQILQRVAPERQPLLIAIAERLAAERYRGWADQMPDVRRKAELCACAAREEQIAGRVEALYQNAAAIQRDILAANPDFEQINRSLFAGRPLEQQFTLQAQGERLGAATWRAFAQREPAACETFLACAEMEEQSADVLESILRAEP